MAEKNGERKERSLKDLGVIYISGAIDSGASEKVCTEIIELNLGCTTDFIQLIINSPGGSVSDGFAIIDMMAWSRLPIRTTGLGMLGSMGLLIFMAGTHGHRVITPRTSVLSHRFSWWSVGNHSELLAKRKEEDLTHARIVDHYLRHTGMKTEEELQTKLLRDVDTWLTAEETVRHGIADIIEGQGPVGLEGTR